MNSNRIVVIGSSAGGVEALRTFCAALPADFGAPVFIAQHISPSARSVLAELLDRAGPLSAVTPTDGEPIVAGRIYVAAPDLHMLVRRDEILMRRGPHENRTRPAANALFRSAAVSYGSATIGVVLTGLLDDGTEGLIAITAGGGISVVQDPADAEWPSMPKNALARGHVDHVVPITELAALLTRLISEPAGPDLPLPREYVVEDKIAAQEFSVMEPELTAPGAPSHLSCPDCGGVLNQIEAQNEYRFRCQVGHAFTPLGLAEAQSDELERALSVAVRTHHDRMKLFGQMRNSAHARGLQMAEARWVYAAEYAARMITVLEDAMVALRKATPDAEG